MRQPMLPIINEDMDYGQMGDRVRKCREHVAISQAQAAKMAGVSASFYGHIERGTRKSSLETIMKLTRMYNVSCDFLLNGAFDTEDSDIKAVLGEIYILLKGKQGK